MARRLAMPLTLAGGRAATVEAGSDADVAQSVALALTTVPGERLWAPQVGMRPQRGATLLDESAVQEAIDSAELGAARDRVRIADIRVLSDGAPARGRVHATSLTGGVVLVSGPAVQDNRDGTFTVTGVAAEPDGTFSVERLSQASHGVNIQVHVGDVAMEVSA